MTTRLIAEAALAALNARNCADEGLAFRVLEKALIAAYGREAIRGADGKLARALPSIHNGRLDAPGLRMFASRYRSGTVERDKLIAAADEIERLGLMADRLLAHCPVDECMGCGEIVCPHGEGLHFHHDGCPACCAHDAGAAVPARKASGEAPSVASKWEIKDYNIPLNTEQIAFLLDCIDIARAENFCGTGRLSEISPKRDPFEAAKELFDRFALLAGNG